MPKTPSQKKNSRRKRVSLGRQEESQARRRFVAFVTVLPKTTFSHFFRPQQFETCCAFCNSQYISLSRPDFQRESAVTFVAPLSNHSTTLLKKMPPPSPPPLKPTPPRNLNAPPAKTNKQSLRWQRM